MSVNSNYLHFFTDDGRIMGPYPLKQCSSFRLNKQHCTNHYDLDTAEMVNLYENRLIRPSYKYTVTSNAANIEYDTSNIYKYKVFESSAYSNCNCRLPTHRMNAIWRFQLISNSKKYIKHKYYLYFGNIIEDYHFLHTAIIWIQISVTFIIFIYDSNTYFTFNNLSSFYCILLILSIIWFIIARICHLNGLFENKITTKNIINSSTSWTINGTSLPTIRSWISQLVIQCIQSNTEKRIKFIHLFIFCFWILFLIICPSTALRFCVVITNNNLEFLWILPKHYTLQQDISWFIFNKIIKKRKQFTNLTEIQLKTMMSHILNAIIISEMMQLRVQISGATQQQQFAKEMELRMVKLNKLREKHLKCLGKYFNNLRTVSSDTESVCNHLKIFQKEHINICKYHYFDFVKPSVMLSGCYHFLFWNDSIAIVFLINVSLFRAYFMYQSESYFSYIYGIDFLCNIVGLICVIFLLWYQLYHHWYDVDIITNKTLFWMDPELIPNMTQYFQPVHQYILSIENLFLTCFEIYIKNDIYGDIIYKCLRDLKINDDIINIILKFIFNDNFVIDTIKQLQLQSLSPYNCSKMHENVNKTIQKLCKLYQTI